MEMENKQEYGRFNSRYIIVILNIGLNIPI